MSDQAFITLNATLQGLALLYEELLGVARRKQEHLIHNDIAALGQDLTQEEPVIRKIERLESERQRVHRECCLTLGLAQETRRVEDILPLLPQPIGRDLRRWRDRLCAILDDLREVNTTNVALISTSLDIIEGALQAVFGVENPAEAYDACGAKTSAFAYGSSFRATL